MVDRTITGRHGDIALRDYIPDQSPVGLAPFVWVHGGGFMSGDLDFAETHAPAAMIAGAGREVVTVNYRLVPRFPLIFPARLKPSDNRYPVPVDDVVDAFADTVLRHPGRDVILGGASAGACLAASAAIRLHERGGPSPSALALVYGTFHGILPPVSKAAREALPFTARLLMRGPDLGRRMNLNYVGSEKLLKDPTVFPGTADVRGLPRSLVLNAERDGLRPSGVAFADHLRAADVPVDEILLPGSTHGYLSRPKSAAFRQGMTVLIEWLDAQDDPTSPM